jgi:DNA-binding NarL/FixJ family response regulator
MKAANNQRNTDEMKAIRHEEWLRSLGSKRQKTEPIVIKMPVPKIGKTALILSERELEVLQLVSFGYTTKGIAEELFISPHTVTNHRKNMLTRSRCGNLAELVRVAITENLL